MPRLRRFITAIGWLLVASGIALNEVVLRALFSSDGHVEPLTVARIRLAQLLLAAAGTAVVVVGRRLSAGIRPHVLIAEHPRLTGLGAGCLLAGGVWLVAEATCGWLLSRPGSPTVTTEVRHADGRITETVAEADSNLGYRLIPNLDARMRLVNAEGAAVYDIDVVTDAYGRRITPVSQTTARSNFALFFGCSFTWGDAVRGHETMPAAFARYAASFRPYNYGFRGYGPQHALEQLRTLSVRTQVPERSGVAVFTLIDEHFKRAIGSMRIVSGVRRAFPYYDLAGGKLVRYGSFVSGRPWRQLLYDAAASSRVVEYFGLDLPPAISERHLELTAAIIAETRSEYLTAFGNDRFFVVLYPGQHLAVRLRPYLDRLGVAYLDYVGLLDNEKQALTIAGDGHPTPLAYGLVAERLAADIGSALSESPQLAREPTKVP
jgi:hypothetical protein